MKDPTHLLNVYRGTTGEGIPNCESAKLCAGKQIDDNLKQRYLDESNYRLPRHAPNFQKPRVYNPDGTPK